MKSYVAITFLITWTSCCTNGYTYLYDTSGCSYCGYVSGRSYIPIPIGTVEAPTYSSSSVQIPSYSVQIPSVTHEYVIQTAPTYRYTQDPVVIDMPPIHVYPQRYKPVQYMPTYEVQYKPVVQQTYAPQPIKTYTVFRQDALTRYGRNLNEETAFERQNGGAYKNKMDNMDLENLSGHRNRENLGSDRNTENLSSSTNSQSQTDDLFEAFGSTQSPTIVKSEQSSRPTGRNLAMETETESEASSRSKTTNPFGSIEERGGR